MITKFRDILEEEQYITRSLVDNANKINTKALETYSLRDNIISLNKLITLIKMERLQSNYQPFTLSKNIEDITQELEIWKYQQHKVKTK